MSKQNLTMEELFDLIHRKQAESLLKLLEAGDLTPPMYSAINKFLSDNNISGVRNKDSTLNKLSDGLDAFEASQADNVIGFPK